MRGNKLFAPVAAIAAAAVVLLCVNFGLRGTAEKNAGAARDEIMAYMLPGRPTSFTEETYDGEDESIRRVFRAEDGCVLEVEAAGYAGPMVLWVGVTNQGRVSGLTVRSHGETFGLGRGAQTDWEFLMQYLGTEGEAAVGENIDALTGATVTSKAVTRAVNSAVAFVTGADTVSSATEWGG